MRLRRYEASGAEAEFESGSRGRVLRNLAGIRSKRAMDQAEYLALVRAREASFHRIAADTQFTAALICGLHRDWLGALYVWAGRYRTVELEKAGFRWPPAHRVAENMRTFEQDVLARFTPCVPDSIPATARRMAEVHAELLLIHPFRDGNGRVARWVTDLMALQAGYPLPRYGLHGRGASTRGARYIEAVQAGYLQDYDALTGFFSEALERGLRHSEG
jgi:cell filamentation protein